MNDIEFKFKLIRSQSIDIVNLLRTVRTMCCDPSVYKWNSLLWNEMTGTAFLCNKWCRTSNRIIEFHMNCAPFPSFLFHIGCE